MINTLRCVSIKGVEISIRTNTTVVTRRVYIFVIEIPALLSETVSLLLCGCVHDNQLHGGAVAKKRK